MFVEALFQGKKNPFFRLKKLKVDKKFFLGYLWYVYKQAVMN